MKTAEKKAKAYAKKMIVLENRDKFSDEANLRAAEYYAYKTYLAGYAEAFRQFSEIDELKKDFLDHIEMMRGDEEIGLYDDNPKNH